MSARRAVVIGGSLGGLLAANLLRTIGWDVAVFERSTDDLSSRGAGLGTHDELFAVLSRIGIDCGGGLGAPIRSRLCLDHDGSIYCEVPIRSVTTAWDRVYRALREALTSRYYRAGVAFQRLEQRASGVRAFFADGSCVDADLLIAADGIHSTARAQLIPDSEPRYAGYVGWRGAVAASDIPAAWRELTLHHMNFCFPEGELALSVPMPSIACPGDADRVQVTWFRPTESEIRLRELCTDDAGRCHGTSIPPTAVRRSIVQEVKDRAEILAPQMSALVRALSQPLLQPIFDLEAPRVVFGRALLLGDAAFVARPHVGTGVTKAALDAATLVNALHALGDIGAALACYERDRLDYGRRLVARGRSLGAYLEAQLKPREVRNRSELYRHPEVVMRQFGAAGETAI